MLEVGGGGGALTERLAAEVTCLHVIEVDERLREELEPLARDAGNVNLVWGDALRVDLAELAPAPTRFNWTCSVTTRATLRSIQRSKTTSGLTSLAC